MRCTNVNSDQLALLKNYFTYHVPRGPTGRCYDAAVMKVTLATFAVFVLTGGVLDANKAFTSLSLLNILRFPMSVLPMMISFSVTVSLRSETRQKSFCHCT